MLFKEEDRAEFLQEAMPDIKITAVPKVELVRQNNHMLVLFVM